MADSKSYNQTYYATITKPQREMDKENRTIVPELKKKLFVLRIENTSLINEVSDLTQRNQALERYINTLVGETQSIPEILNARSY
jgi:hypothetical protein